MTRRLLVLAVVLLFVVAIASIIWAAQTKSGSPGKPVMQVGAKAGLPDHDRCTKTCDTLMNYYHATFTKMKVHEGDKQCWQNCWSRFGEEDAKPTTAQMKSLWKSKQKQNMRANQCAQACWRMHHDNSKTVSVAGWRSTPRPIICYK